MQSKQHFKLEDEKYQDRVDQVLTEYRNGEKLRSWKKPDKAAKFFVNLVVQNVRFNHSMSTEGRHGQSPPESISQHFRYLQGTGAIEYKTGKHSASFHRFVDASHPGSDPVDTFDVYVYPNTELAVRFACRNFHNLHLEQGCRNGNFYHLYLNFPRITLLVFAESDYFDMLFEDVKKSASPLVQLGLDLSQNNDLFLLYQEFKPAETFPHTGIICIAKEGFLKTVDTSDETGLATFVEPKTGHSMLPLSYLLFSSGKASGPKPVEPASVDMSAIIRKTHVLMYFILGILSVIFVFLLIRFL